MSETNRDHSQTCVRRRVTCAGRKRRAQDALGSRGGAQGDAVLAEVANARIRWARARTEGSQRGHHLVNGAPRHRLKVLIQRHEIGLAEHRNRAREGEPVVIRGGHGLTACQRPNEQVIRVGVGALKVEALCASRARGG